MPYIVMTASSGCPARRQGEYRKVALLEVEEDASPAMISEQAKGVKRIVRICDGLFVGKTPKSAFYRVLEEMEEEADRLNREAWEKKTCGS